MNAYQNMYYTNEYSMVIPEITITVITLHYNYYTIILDSVCPTPSRAPLKKFLNTPLSASFHMTCRLTTPIRVLRKIFWTI